MVWVERKDAEWVSGLVVSIDSSIGRIEGPTRPEGACSQRRIADLNLYRILVEGI